MEEEKKLSDVLEDKNNKEKFLNKKYMMHKYWGKKPAKELKKLIREYSKEGDLLLDPFAGYGSFASEAILENRNVVANDLNPVSNFITECLLNEKIDIEKFQKYYELVQKKCKKTRKELYWYNSDWEIISALRNKNGYIKKIKLKNKNKRENKEIKINFREMIKLYEQEKKIKISEWYPNIEMIENSRISVKENTKIVDFFNKISLKAHANLYSEIEKLPDGIEKKMLLLAFSSNLANCSKLVPPIKSRGEMSQGAWMTGFYIGTEYIENNVYHYFENRVKKIISGKKEFLNQYYNLFPKGKYKITNMDAKKLEFEDNTFDLIFTDFPYGDTVPYFEQSVLWNAWLKYSVDYKNEIVISNSKIRNKTKEKFREDIEKAIKEIHRVLKLNKKFIFTYHSLSGFEWLSITNALQLTGFEIIDCELLQQKTFTPRQLNRNHSIKGDLIVVCKKIKNKKLKKIKNENKIYLEILNDIFQDNNKVYITNDIFVKFLKKLFKMNIYLTDLNIYSLLLQYASPTMNGWRKK